MLLFATSAASLFFWKKCVENEQKLFNYLWLFLSLTAAPYSHLYGTFSYLPIVVGETIRLWLNKKFYSRIYLVIFLSSLSLVFLYPFIANAAKFSAHFWTILHISKPFDCYKKLLDGILYLSASAIVIVVPLAFFGARLQSEDLSKSNKNIPIYEIAAAVTLCLIPFFQFIIAVTITKAFHHRYAIISVIGFAILFAYGCQVLERKKPGLCLAMTACVLLSSWFQLAKITKSNISPAEAKQTEFISFIETANIPIVISKSHLFLFNNFYLPDHVKKQIHYLIDENESIRYLGHNSDETALVNLKKIRDIQIAGYKNFHEIHKKYYVVARSSYDGWLIRKILDGFKQGLIDIELSFLSHDLKIIKVRYIN
jgi:hypothetical protein